MFISSKSITIQCFLLVSFTSVSVDLSHLLLLCYVVCHRLASCSISLTIEWCKYSKVVNSFVSSCHCSLWYKYKALVFSSFIFYPSISCQSCNVCRFFRFTVVNDDRSSTPAPQTGCVCFEYLWILYTKFSNVAMNWMHFDAIVFLWKRILLLCYMMSWLSNCFQLVSPFFTVIL